MCVSRLHRVVGTPDPDWIEVDDIDGTRHLVSLLAYDGPVPEPGQWVVVHSGYALGPIDAAEAEGIVAELLSSTELGKAAPMPPATP
jgi:hydrogenase maturation factor